MQAACLRAMEKCELTLLDFLGVVNLYFLNIRRMCPEQDQFLRAFWHSLSHPFIQPPEQQSGEHGFSISFNIDLGFVQSTRPAGIFINHSGKSVAIKQQIEIPVLVVVLQ